MEAVRGVGLDPDSAGGAVALSYLLTGDTADRPEQPEHRRSDEPQFGPDEQDPAASVARWVGVDTATIKDHIEFAEAKGVPRPPNSRLPRSKADRQRVLTLLTLAVNRIGYGQEEVPSSEVNALAAEYASLDQNLPHNISQRGELITRRGKRGAFEYRATQPGLERARDLLRELVAGTEQLLA